MASYFLGDHELPSAQLKTKFFRLLLILLFTFEYQYNSFSERTIFAFSVLERPFFIRVSRFLWYLTFHQNTDAACQKSHRF